jgi:hypothetical protein
MSNWFKGLFGGKKDCCCHKGEACCHEEKNNKEEATVTPTATPEASSEVQAANINETPKTE